MDGNEMMDPVQEPEFTNLLFFSDDLKYQDKKRRVLKNYQYYPHESSLNLWYFLEAFILNFLQMSVMGPFIWIFIAYPPYLKLMSNMEFFALSKKYFLSLVIWVCNIMVLLCHFYWGYSAIDYGYFALPLVVIGVRAANIAARYATFTPKYRNRLLGTFVQQEEINQHLLLGGWSNQVHHFAENEIFNAMMRRSIDDSTFKLAFIVEPSERAQQLLDDVKSQNQAMGEIRIETDFGSTAYYDCKTIIYTLIRYHMKVKKRDWVFVVFIFFSMLWGTSPGISRVVADLNFAGSEVVEIVTFIGAMVFYTLLMIFVTIFFITAYFDYDRVVFGLEQLSQMYSPDNLTQIQDKILPTINLADAVSLQGWINMRKVLIEYGKPFFNRHKIFVPTILGVAILSAVGVFTLSAFTMGLTEEERFRIQGPLSFTFLLFGLMFLLLVRKGQLINDQFKTHIELLRENQQIFQTFHHFRDYYIGEMAEKELPYKVNGIFTKKTQSFIHEKMSTEAKRLIGDNKHICNEYIEKLVEMQEEFIVEIEKEYRFNAKTLLGLNINFAVMGFFFVSYLITIFYGYYASWDKYLLK